MNDFQELLAVDFKTTFNFFFTNIKDVISDRRLNENETLYVTSVLTHYAQVSRHSDIYFPCLADLSEVFEYFILQSSGLVDSEILEICGSQTLLFAGFFRSQMSYRHNVEWYDQIGQQFYDRASRYSRDRKRRMLLEQMSVSFPIWTTVCRNLNRNLRENQFLLKLQ